MLEPTGEKLVLALESRRALDLPLSKVLTRGEIAVFPHVEARGLLFLQFRRGQVTLTAGRYVGLIPLTPNIVVDVRPKLPVSNLSRVLDRARVSIDVIQGVDRLYLESGAPSSSILEFLLWNLVSALQPIRQNGIVKEYQRGLAVSSHPRGRIHMAGTLQSCLTRGMRHKVKVERFNQTSDLPANRLLKAALVYLLTALSKGPADRKLIARANDAFCDFPEQIGQMSYADYQRCRAVVEARSLPTTRSYYYRALEIGLLVLAGRTISLDKPGDDLMLDTFIVDFERVFEQYLRRTLQSLTSDDIVVRDGNAEGKKPLFDDRSEPPAQPDIVLNRRGTDRPLVVEVKYKDKPDRADINQAVTYALTYRSERVILVHQCKAVGQGGLRRLGSINGIAVEAYGFDLGNADLSEEEQAFATCLFDMLPEAPSVSPQILPTSPASSPVIQKEASRKI